MSNIIDSIRLSGTTYQIQGEITVDAALDSGSTNPVANSAITTALGDKVNVADNNASAYTFENKIGRAEYSYSEQFAGPIYIRYTGSLSLSGSYYAGRILCYSESAIENISLYFNLSDGQITATTVSSVYFDIEIENGEAALTFKNGYYLRQYISQNGFVALTKTTYESGQSANVIEDTVYDVFDKLNDKIDKTDDNAVTGNSINFSNGYLESYLHTNKTTLFSSTKIDSSTIKSSINDGLSVQFATPEAVDKILNVGSGSYGTLFSTSSYDTSINEFTITFNPNCTQYSVYEFSVQVKDASNVGYGGIFEYNSSDMSAEYTDLSTYCTVTDTLSTDYKLKVTAKEGYKISRLFSSRYMVGGVDNTTPNNYISNLVTAPSYVHDGQDVIDDIYDKLGGINDIEDRLSEDEEVTAAALNELNDTISGKVDTSTYNTYTAATDTALNGKQPTLVSGTNIKTINNESILGSGNIDIQGGSVTVDSALSPTSENPVQNKVIYSKIDEVEEVTAAGLNALNDKITPTVELTQAEYDALVSAGTVSADTYYIITDAQAGDLTNYYTKTETNTLLGGKADTATTYTKTEVDNAITTATSTKQDTLQSGTNIKTINNESLLGSGNINIQGGGKAVSGGTNISITTGETADTINCTLPISADTGGIYTTSSYPFTSTAPRSYNAVFGNSNVIDVFGNTRSSNFNALFGNNNGVRADGGNSSSHFIAGSYNNVRGTNNYQNALFGYYNNSRNNSEFGCGRYNNSVAASTTFGDSGNTLFSVGNGTADNARHNAFEIRQNGDIYLTKDGQDVKLQDQLGGGSSYTAGDGIDITNDVISVTGKADTSAVTAIQDSLSGYVTTDTEQIISGRKIFTYTSNSNKAIEFKQTSDSVKVGFSIKNSASTNNEVASFEFRPNTFTIDGVQHPLMYFGHYRNKNTANAGVPQTVIGFRQYDQLNLASYHYLLPLPEKAKTPFNLTTSFKDYYAPIGFKNGSTMITADNTGVVDLSSELGGLKLVKLTQAEYNAIATKDSSTLYIIVN